MGICLQNDIGNGKEVGDVKRPERRKLSQQDLEEVLTDLGDFVEFTKSSDDELSLEELEFVTAAASQTPYQRFLRNMDLEREDES